MPKEVVLCRWTLSDRGLIDKIRYVRTEREHIIAIRAYQRGLGLHTLHYINEIRPLEDIKEISETKVHPTDEK